MTLDVGVHLFLLVILGYLFGRWSHYYLNLATGNLSWPPHHWLYALVMIILGLFFSETFWGPVFVYFGAGFFVSDWNDFIKLRFFGADDTTKHNFWGFD